MWQEVAVGIIGIIILIYIGWKIYDMVIHSTKTKDTCIGCKGCGMRNHKLIKNNLDK